MKILVRELLELSIGVVTAAVGAAYALELQPAVQGGAHIILGSMITVGGGMQCYRSFKPDAAESGDDNNPSANA